MGWLCDDDECDYDDDDDCDDDECDYEDDFEDGQYEDGLAWHD